MRILTVALIVGVATLAGCQTAKPPTVITKEIYRVPSPPKVLFNCPQVSPANFPNPDTATNQEISDFIVDLYRKLKTCGTNMQKLEKWFTEAQFILETNDRDAILAFIDKSEKLYKNSK